MTTVQTLEEALKQMFPNFEVKVKDSEGNEHEIIGIEQDIMRDVVLIIGD